MKPILSFGPHAFLKMVPVKVAVCVLAAALCAGAADKNSRQNIDLAGDWHYLPYNGAGEMATIDDRSWPVMHLPSNWYLMGGKTYPAKASAMNPPLASNSPGQLVTPDPAYGLDFSGTMWFRKTISHPALRPGKFMILDLDMVDYYTDVYVNGQKAGSHEGYFQRWSVNLTPYLKAGENDITLRVSAPSQTFDMAQQFPISWPKAQNQIKGIFAYHDTRPGATSARGQERATGGVIRGVGLHESSGVDIAEIKVLPTQVSASQASLHIEAVVHNWSNEPRQVKINARAWGANFRGPVIPIAISGAATPGESRLSADVTVQRPELWWSWDYGKQNLYRLEATMQDASGQSLAAAATRFGIRSISHDQDWVWRLNGKRIYPRGSNYISTQWLSQADKAWSDRDVKLMRGANLNSIRVHAHLERPEFYEAADEQGVMVWQDYPLQWGYTDTPEFHREALRQAADMVDRYCNYPSIIVWSMHNESPHAMDWMQKRDPKQNLVLDNELAEEVAKLDPSRVTHRDSGTGDGHIYPGWYDRSLPDFPSAKTAKFLTEYGAEALPNLQTLRQIFDAKTLWPQAATDWEIWKYANFQPEQTFEYGHIKKGANIEEFVHNSQLYQANLVRYITEGMRRMKYDRSTGLYHFMFVEDWPSITWAVVDYYREPKRGYLALRSAMQPVLPSIAYQVLEPSQPLELYIVNDTYSAYPKAHLKWRTDKGEAHDKVVDVPADASIKVAELGAMPAVTSGGSTLVVWLEDATGKKLGENSLSAENFIAKQ